jgi:hypothetical protein
MKSQSSSASLKFTTPEIRTSLGTGGPKRMPLEAFNEAEMAKDKKRMKSKSSAMKSAKMPKVKPSKKSKK